LFLLFEKETVDPVIELLRVFFAYDKGRTGDFIENEFIFGESAESVDTGDIGRKDFPGDEIGGNQGEIISLAGIKLTEQIPG
jgi:hypothetical protein